MKLSTEQMKELYRILNRNIEGFPEAFKKDAKPAMVEFKDYYGAPCSLQASSLAIYKQPGTSAVWIGIDDAQPKVMASQAAALGINTEKTTGWVPYPIPKEVSLNTRMHLDRKQVKALIGHLQVWLDSDEGKFV